MILHPETAFEVLPKEKALCDICQTDTPTALRATGWDFEYTTSHEEFQLVSCRKCELLFLLNRPSYEAMPIIYPENYYAYEESRLQNPLVQTIRNCLETMKTKKYKQLVSSNEEKHILDIGCGDGRLLDILKEQTGVKWRLHGIEIGTSAIAEAKRKGYEVICGNIETAHLSHWENRFDLILMHQVLEHLRSPRLSLRKIRSLLKQKGILSIETPDTESWDRRIFGNRYWGGYHIPRHFYLFNKRNLKFLLEEEGFKVLSYRSLASPVFWIHSIHNWLLERPHLKQWAKFFHYQNPFLLVPATLLDIIQIGLLSQSSNMQMIVQKDS